MIKIQSAPIVGTDRLREALKDAVRLELAIIPPYLTASLTLAGTGPGPTYARSLIRDIVIEEMLHINLVCNIMNAIGAAPRLNTPDVVPRYPGPLPMAIAGLDIHLERYSKSLVGGVFMKIEEPEIPVEIPVALSVLEEPPPPKTIGEFYRAIASEIARLGSALFVGDPTKQVVLGRFDDPSEDIAVTDVQSALAAIDTIVRQGEGTPQSPRDLQSDIAHYYRFQELEKGMKLRDDPASPATVVFDPEQPIAIDDQADVIAMVDDPQLVAIDPADAEAAQLSDECDRLYAEMLDSLQTGFNGQPGEVHVAINKMQQFNQTARTLLEQPLTAGAGAGTFAGPRFLYAP